MTYSASIAAASSATCTAVATVLSVAAISDHSSNYPTHTGSGDDDVEDLPGSGDDGGLLLGSGDNEVEIFVAVVTIMVEETGLGRTTASQLLEEREEQLHSDFRQKSSFTVARKRGKISGLGGADISSLKGQLHSALGEGQTFSV